MSVQPSERRREQRFSIRLPAHVSLDGRAFAGLEVRDYCSGGMLLVADGSATGPIELPSVGARVDIALTLGAGANRRRLRLSAHVAHRVERGFGAAFFEPNTALLDLLRDEGKIRNAPHDGGPTASTEGVTKLDEARVSAAVIRVGKAAFTRIFGLILHHLPEPLEKRAESTDELSEAQDIAKDLGVLRAVNDDEVGELVRSLVSRVMGKERKGEFSNMSSSELSLLEKDDFESWLIGSRMVTRMDDKYGRELEGIRSALSRDAGGGQIFGGDAPFSPAQVADSLSEFADRLHLSRASRLVLFDTANAVLDKSLASVYESLSTSLEAIGLELPGLNVRHRPGAVNSGARGQTETVATATPAPIAELLPENRPAGQCYDINDLLNVLPRGQAANDTDFDALLAQLREAAAQGKVLGGKAEERTRFAGDLIENLRADESIEPHTLEWLRSLQMPLLREALADGQFFRDERHPLREVVDQVGHLSLFFTNLDEAQSSESIREALNGIFDNLQEIDEGDEEGYQHIAQAISRLAEDESDKFQRNVERVVESCTGRDRLLRTRIAVIEELNGRYAGKEVPTEAVELLEVGWRAQLELAYLRVEDGGAEYRRDLELLDDLVALLGGAAVDTDRDRLENRELHSQIRQVLEASAFDPFRKMRLIDQVHARLVYEEPGEQVVFEPLELPPEARDHISTPEGVDRLAWIEALEAVEALEIGEALQLTHDGREQTLRLVWRNEDKTQFTLVDHQGLRAADFKRSELARRMHEQQARKVQTDDRPLTERAVDNLMADMGRRLNDNVVKDPLTGLQTRRSFQSLLERRASTKEAEFEPFVLLWMNLDNFRVINDSASFEAGDALLSEVANLLQAQYNVNAALGYLGGDGFAVLLDAVDQEAGLVAAERTRGLLEEMSFQWEGRKYRISARIGVLELSEPVVNPTRVMRAADAALGAARQAGGNRVYGYTLEDEAIARQVNAVQWIARVDDALESGCLKLRCQKIVPVVANGSQHLHYEVLLGVRDSTGEDLNINEFITAAESSNRMPRVDRWIAETAVQWLGQHRQRFDDIGGLAINLSGQTVNDESFVDFVRKLLNDNDVEAGRVSFEVTETATIANLNHTSRIIRAIKHLGCRVALDDFGSGLASYSYLKELPVDTLKIDGVFVKNMATNAKDYAVVKSINEIGHFMGMETIAEYVVDEDVLAKLREIGVDYAQGFGIERPHLLDDLA